MPRSNALLVGLIVLSASFFACHAGTIQGPAEISPGSLALELDRAILILNRGLKNNWRTRDQYLTAFEKTPNTDPAGRSVTDAKRYIECEIGANLRVHQTWDEGPPVEVEVRRTIVEFTRLRIEAEGAKAVKTGFSYSEGQAAELHLPPCGGTSPRRVAISAGVAASMLKTKIDPVYPAEALRDHVSGTVVFQATISTEGLVKSLRLVSGPRPLQQAALDAVKRWTYRPYLLDNIPVEVETTINVVFARSF